jgi:hypothetical protein
MLWALFASPEKDRLAIEMVNSSHFRRYGSAPLGVTRRQASSPDMAGGR